MNFFGAIVPTFRFCVTILKKINLEKMCLSAFFGGVGESTIYFSILSRPRGTKDKEDFVLQIGTFSSLGLR